MLKDLRKYIDKRKICHMILNDAETTYGPMTIFKWLGLLALVGLAACSRAPSVQGISDPHEKENRVVHDLNVKLDRAIVRPVATGVAKTLPTPVEVGITNFAGNLEIPGTVVNDVLQARLGLAFQNTLRFAVNSTVGLGGLFDPAAKMGAPAKPSDFGETLHVWGVAEGDYIELPLLGPSTQRDTLGKVVDYFLDPLSMIVPKPAHLGLYSKLAAKISDRGRYTETIDSILYDSADGYAQSRLLYLEHRRFNLGEAPSDTTFEDPYAQ